MEKAKYKRVLLKLSGEVLSGDQDYGISNSMMKRISLELTEINQAGVEIAVVMGGGNIFRGITQEQQGMDRSTADYMGMLATIINCLALQDALERSGVQSRVQSAIEMHEVAEPFIRRRAIRHLEKGRIVIFAAGTGNPYFTTDTAASLRASEINAEIILKATKVDGIYDSDPEKNPNAKKYDELEYIDFLNNHLKAMDATAISLCMDNNLPIIVFNLQEKGNIKAAIWGNKNLGTLVRGKK